jgi:hypothetical protein
LPPQAAATTVTARSYNSRQKAGNIAPLSQEDSYRRRAYP